MKKLLVYKVIIGCLLLVILAQWVYILRSPGKKPEPTPKVKLKGKIAIVLDDWGYNLNNLRLASQIKSPLTISVLPGLGYSRRVSEEMHRHGFEIILHLPLEPMEKINLEKNTIVTSMDEDTVKNILDKHLSSISYAKGVSNHMGSKATTDMRIMGIILHELKKRKLYFLDSYVSVKSVCADIAATLRVGRARRDIFLDNRADTEYIKGQLKKLKYKASAYGQAVGIGHDRPNTLKVLKEAMPQLEREGYRFVFVSDLVR